MNGGASDIVRNVLDDDKHEEKKKVVDREHSVNESERRQKMTPSPTMKDSLLSDLLTEDRAEIVETSTNIDASESSPYGDGSDANEKSREKNIEEMAKAALRAFGILEVDDDRPTAIDTKESASAEQKETSHSTDVITSQNDQQQKMMKVAKSSLKDSATYIPPPLPLYETKKDGGSISPPKTGMETTILWPSPYHLRDVPTEDEPFVPLNENIEADVRKLHAMRASHPKDVRKRVVFDSIELSERQLQKRTKVRHERRITEDGVDETTTPRSIPLSTPSSPSHVVTRDDIEGGRPGYNVDSDEVKTIHSWYLPASAEDTTLVFESRFEGGNLRRAVQVYEYEYDLTLKPDLNTNRHTQWFYFECRNTRAGTTYKFNIVNLLKSDSLYNYGMRPLLYSNALAKKKKCGWRRCGENICYYSNGSKRSMLSSSRRRATSYYTLTFTVEFPADDDVVYLAMCYPYSYTDLRQDILSLMNDPVRSQYVRRRPLCLTLGGNICDLLTISSFDEDRVNRRTPDPSCTGDEKEMKSKEKRAVLVSARVHPGETNASWMMKGFLDYVTGSSTDAQILRKNFIFKVVPMLNPDGVTVGNYRCSLAGIDLNRSYISPSRKVHPTIFYTKQMVKRLCTERDVVLSIDLHGHSKKMNIFMYGCETKPEERRLFLRERVFPRMLWKNGKVFSYRDCNFKVRKSKESTARVVFCREMGIRNAYTMEASFAGASFGECKGRHFTTTDLESMGRSFCDTLLDYCDPDQSKVDMTLKEIRKIYSVAKSLHENDGSDDGSDSDSDAAVASSSTKKTKSGRKRTSLVSAAKAVKRGSRKSSAQRAYEIYSEDMSDNKGGDATEVKRPKTGRRRRRKKKRGSNSKRKKRGGKEIESRSQESPVRGKMLPSKKSRMRRRGKTLTAHDVEKDSVLHHQQRHHRYSGPAGCRPLSSEADDAHSSTPTVDTKSFVDDVRGIMGPLTPSFSYMSRKTSENRLRSRKRRGPSSFSASSCLADSSTTMSRRTDANPHSASAEEVDADEYASVVTSKVVSSAHHAREDRDAMVALRMSKAAKLMRRATDIRRAAASLAAATRQFDKTSLGSVSEDVRLGLGKAERENERSRRGRLSPAKHISAREAIADLDREIDSRRVGNDRTSSQHSLGPSSRRHRSQRRIRHVTSERRPGPLSVDATYGSSSSPKNALRRTTSLPKLTGASPKAIHTIIQNRTRFGDRMGSFGGL